MIESRAKKPSTIVGMPASSSRIGLTVRRTPSGAYSERKIADPETEGDRDRPPR